MSYIEEQTTAVIWKLYQKASSKKAHYLNCRNRKAWGDGSFGIAIETDEYALAWQRYDKLQRKLLAALDRRIAEADELRVENATLAIANERLVRKVDRLRGDKNDLLTELEIAQRDIETLTSF